MRKFKPTIIAAFLIAAPFGVSAYMITRPSALTGDSKPEEKPERDGSRDKPFLEERGLYAIVPRRDEEIQGAFYEAIYRSGRGLNGRSNGQRGTETMRNYRPRQTAHRG